MSDYSLSAAEVYEATARALVGQGHVNILKWCRPCQRRPPSWVPDWEKRIESTWSEGSGTKVFNAVRGRAQPACDDGANESLRAGSVLRFRGAVAGRVSDVGSVWVADPALSFDQAACRRMFAEVEAFVEESRYSEVERAGARWRVPIGDKELPLRSPFFVRATERSKEQYAILAAGPLNTDGTEKTYHYQTVMGYIPGARPVLFEDGHVGLRPSEAEAGDVLVLIWGVSTPYILRSRTDTAGGWYCLIGEAFMYGMMDGEMMDRDLRKMCSSCGSWRSACGP